MVGNQLTIAAADQYSLTGSNSVFFRGSIYLDQPSNGMLNYLQKQSDEADEPLRLTVIYWEKRS